MRILTGPTVQLGLDLQYPKLGTHQRRLQLIGIHRRTSRHSSFRSADLLALFAMYAPLARSDYCRASALPDGHQPATSLPTTVLDGQWTGRPRIVPTFTRHRSARSAASSTPTASPRLRRRPSAWPPHRRLHSATELTYRLTDS